MATVSCRDTEISALISIIHSTCRPSSLVINGPHQTGKSLVLSSILEASETKYYVIDCETCINARSLFETVLARIDQSTFTVEDGHLTHPGTVVDTLDVFLVKLEQVMKGQDIILVFDHFSSITYEIAPIYQGIHEVLQRLEDNQLAIFVISSTDDVLRAPAPSIYFRPYSNDEICQMLQQSPAEVDLDISEEQCRSLWNRYCKTFYSAVNEIIGHDLNLLKLVATKIFPLYIQPIKDNIRSTTDHTQLGRAAQKHLMPEPWVLQEESIFAQASSSTSDRTKLLDLSEPARYLLIAAYLASYNSVKTDRTFFSRGKGEKTRRKRKNHVRVEKLPQRLLGPKGFVLVRMTAIFHAILPKSIDHDVLLDQEIAILNSLKLILKQGNQSDMLDGGKWIVNISLESALKIAQNLGFELNRYLVSE